MKITLSIVTALLFWSASSQTLTQSFNEPVVGDIDVHYRLDTTAYPNGIPIHQSGQNLVWDFTKLIGDFPIVVDSFITVSAAVGGSAYPNASFVQHRDNLYTFYQSIASPPRTELLGAYSPSLSLTFTNSAIIAGYPVSYGYSLNDPVGGNFKYVTSSGSTNGVCVGSIDISANGIGTAKFNGGVSIPNVLCLKSVEVLTLSIGIAQFGTFRQTIYNYYMPGRKFPVLNVNYTTYALIAGTPTTTAFIYGSNDYFTAVGMDEQQSLNQNPQVYPNPFQSQLFVKPSLLRDETLFQFFDAKGQMVLETHDLSDTRLDQLSSGLYLLRIAGAGTTYSQRILKE